MNTLLPTALLSLLTLFAGPHGDAGDKAPRGPGRGAGICERIECTDAQEAQLKQIFESNKSELADERAEAKQLRTQLQAAKKAGDDDKVAELTAQLKTIRAAMKEARSETREAIDGVLTDAQRAELAEMRAEHEGKRGGHGKRGKGMHAMGRDLCETIACTDAQKTELAAIRAEFKAAHADDREAMKALHSELKAARSAAKPDAAKIAALQAKVDAAKQAHHAEREAMKAKIDSVLTAEQKAQIDKMKAEHKAKKGERRGKGGKDGKRAQRGPRGDGQGKFARADGPRGNGQGKLARGDGSRGQGKLTRGNRPNERTAKGKQVNRSKGKADGGQLARGRGKDKVRGQAFAARSNRSVG